MATPHSTPRFRLAALGAAAALLVTGCATGSSRFTGLADGPSALPSASQPVAVVSTDLRIKGLAFLPDALTVSVGATLRWTNGDLIAHTVTSADGRFDSGLIQHQEVFELTFDEVGTYAYLCTVHPRMRGSIEVVA